MPDAERGFYFLLISVHGLIRGQDLELGRDPDTGGQTKYVIELAQMLGNHPQVNRVDLVTRQVMDAEIDGEYSAEKEVIGDKVNIIRIHDGVDEYLSKEMLWDSLDNFADNLLVYIREQDVLPSLIHSHYADAGLVGSRLSSQLGIPQVHTGHSLGRVKRRRLIAGGLKASEIEKRYNMSRRIDAEEQTLATARLVITSTYQEVEEQYGLYDFYQPSNMSVIPPGTDLTRFKPASGNELESEVFQQLKRFLHQPAKPVILALSRPDQRKNIQALVAAYGESPLLQAQANLVIVAGNREDIRELDEGSQEVMTELLIEIDRYDLYGKVAYPKHHLADEVPLFYQLAALLNGVFVNPALTEPFGLTLLEAAACGLPVVATDDGGPQDIIGNCQNGYLINPLDTEDIQEKLLMALGASERWQRLATNGLDGVKQHYSWKAHVEKYVNIVTPLIEKTEPAEHVELTRRPLLYHDRALFSDLDQNLLGDPELLRPFVEQIKANRKNMSFGIATGRRLDSALQVIKSYGIPQPDILITSLGTEIHYAPNLTRDEAWINHIDYLWRPKRIDTLIKELPGIKRQPKNMLSRFKLSYFIDTEIAPSIDEIKRLLNQYELAVNVIHSFGQFLDIVPERASKGFALRWYAEQWGVPLEHILTAGGSGADEDMMRGNTLAVVVGNRHYEELSDLTDIDRIYFSEQPYAAGIMEAIEHYQFLSDLGKGEA